MTNTTICDDCNGTGNDPGGLNPFYATPCEYCGGAGTDPSFHEYEPCPECHDAPPLWAGEVVERKPVQTETHRERMIA